MAQDRIRMGPEDDSVLTEQATHRSNTIYVDSAQDDNVFTLYQGAQCIFWTNRENPGPEDVQLHPRVMDVLEVMGFYGPFRCGAVKLDRHLITALVERWRPETHTFHFPIGETTITLQDVAIIWGLSIDGEPVICPEPRRTFDEWQVYCSTWLGFEPIRGEMRTNNAINLTAVTEHLKHQHIDWNTPQVRVDQYARGCALILLGGLMVPDSSRSSIRLLYVRFLEDVTRVRTYSWGSAVLAFLYRELCKASQAGVKTISGALSLLQIWAWSRIIAIQPLNIRSMLIRGPLFGANDRNLGIAPYGSRWSSYHDHTRSGRNSIRVYRDIFDRLIDSQFEWEPYDMDSLDISSLSNRCLTVNWLAECPLINVGIVEIHHPNRVLRQFGMIQGIPYAIHVSHSALHELNRRGREGCDWVHLHRDWIVQWNGRKPYQPTVRINGGVSVNNDYMQWYRRITRRIISPNEYTTEFQGFQPSRTSERDVLVQWFSRLKIIHRRTRIDDTSLLVDMYNMIGTLLDEVEPILQTRPYLVDPPIVDNTKGERGDHNTLKRSSSRRDDAGPSTFRK